MLIRIFAVFCLLIMVQPAMADEKSNVEQLIKNRFDGVISVLRAKQMGDQDKRNKITEIITPIFDFELMSKLTLGKANWTSLPKDKRVKFQQLFIEWLKQSYLDKMSLYTDETIAYEPAVVQNKRAQIPVLLISKENKIKMVYKLYSSGGKWKIYDFEIEGVSIIQTYRSQFDQILRAGTIDDLLKKLEKPEDKPTKSIQK